MASISSLAKLMPRSKSVNVEIANIKIDPRGQGISKTRPIINAIILAVLDVIANYRVLIRFLEALLDSMIAVKRETKESFLLVIVISQALFKGSAEVHFDAIDMSEYLNAASSEMLSFKKNKIKIH